MKQHRFQYAILSAIFIVTLVQLAGGAFQLWDDLEHGTERAANPFMFGYRMQVISGLEAAGKRSGAEFGDTLLEFNGRPFTGMTVMEEEVRKARPRSTIAAVIRKGKGGAVVPVTITLDPVNAAPPTAGAWIARILIFLLLPAFCIGIGFWVVLQRPFDPLAWLLLAIMLGFGDLIPRYPWPGALLPPVLVWRSLVGELPLSMVLFGIFFPFRSNFDIQRPWIKWLLIVPLGAIATLDAAFNVARAVSFQPWMTPILFAQLTFKRIIEMVAISVFFMALGEK